MFLKHLDLHISPYPDYGEKANFRSHSSEKGYFKTEDFEDKAGYLY